MADPNVPAAVRLRAAEFCLIARAKVSKLTTLKFAWRSRASSWRQVRTIARRLERLKTDASGYTRGTHAAQLIMERRRRRLEAAGLPSSHAGRLLRVSYDRRSHKTHSRSAHEASARQSNMITRMLARRLERLEDVVFPADAPQLCMRIHSISPDGEVVKTQVVNLGRMHRANSARQSSPYVHCLNALKLDDPKSLSSIGAIGGTGDTQRGASSNSGDVGRLGWLEGNGSTLRDPPFPPPSASCRFHSRATIVVTRVANGMVRRRNAYSGTHHREASSSRARLHRPSP